MSCKAIKEKNADYICTYIDYDIERVIIGQKDTDTAAVLHGFIVVEVQFVHLCVAGTGRLWAHWWPASTTAGTDTTTSPSAAAQYRYTSTYRLSRPNSAHQAEHGDQSCSQPLWRRIRTATYHFALYDLCVLLYVKMVDRKIRNLFEDLNYYLNIANLQIICSHLESDKIREIKDRQAKKEGSKSVCVHEDVTSFQGNVTDSWGKYQRLSGEDVMKCNDGIKICGCGSFTVMFEAQCCSVVLCSHLTEQQNKANWDRKCEAHFSSANIKDIGQWNNVSPCLHCNISQYIEDSGQHTGLQFWQDSSELYLGHFNKPEVQQKM